VELSSIKKMMNDENERRRKMFHSPKRVGKKMEFK